jgi:hypothetical protein
MWPKLSKIIIHVIQAPPVIHPLSKEILDNGYSTTSAAAEFPFFLLITQSA